MITEMTNEDNRKDVAINVRKIQPELRKRFKSFCAEREFSMQDAIICLMEMAIDGKLRLEIEKE